MTGLQVVMVNIWEHVNPRKEARHFCDIHGIKGPVLIDEDGSYAERLGVRGVPYNIIVNKKGIVQSVGDTTPDELRSTLTRMLMPFG